MEQIALISLLTLLVGIVYIFILRSYDMYEPEPFSFMLLATLLGGAASVIISLLVYKFFDVEKNFIDAIIKIGVIEEGSKLLALTGIYYLIRKEFNEIVDGIIYISCVALGFAIIENVFYAVSAEHTYPVLFFRSFICVIGHMAFAGYMGIAFFIHVKVHKNYKGIILAIILAAIAHGFFNTVQFYGELSRFFNIVFGGLVFFQLWLLRIVLSFSKQRENFSSTHFEPSGDTAFGYCVNCEASVKNHEYQFWKINLTFCDQCGRMVLDGENWYRVMEYYRPLFQWQNYFREKLRKDVRNVYFDPEHKVKFNIKRQYGTVEEERFKQWLNEKNIEDRSAFLQKPFVGDILRHLGLKYMVG